MPEPVELWSQYDTLHLMTKAGPIDLVFAPDGAPSGYSDLAGDAVSAELDHQPVMVITVAKWEALEQATGRAKDLEHLDRYYEARREDAECAILTDTGGRSRQPENRFD